MDVSKLNHTSYSNTNRSHWPFCQWDKEKRLERREPEWAWARGWRWSPGAGTLPGKSPDSADMISFLTPLTGNCVKINPDWGLSRSQEPHQTCVYRFVFKSSQRCQKAASDDMHCAGRAWGSQARVTCRDHNQPWAELDLNPGQSVSLLKQTSGSGTLREQMLP